MSIFPTVTPAAVRRALLAKTEIALVDVRHESRFATGHPLFAASFPLGHLEAQAAAGCPAGPCRSWCTGTGPTTRWRRPPAA